MSITNTIIIIIKMDVDIDDMPIPDGQILGLMVSNNGCSCAHRDCCCGSTGKVGSVVFFHWCAVLGEVLQELEDTMQVTMDCDLHPEGQRCRAGYLSSRRIARDTFEATNYVHRTAVVIELLKDSNQQKKKDEYARFKELRYSRFLMKSSRLKMLLRRRKTSK